MFHIRLATAEDALGIARVHVTTWQQAYSDLLPAEFLTSISVEQRRGNWERRLSLGHENTWVAIKEDRVVGFIDIGPCRDKDLPATMGELNAIYCLADVWGQGVAQLLWQEARAKLLQNYATVSLWVLDGNTRAIRFYEGLGFCADGTSKTEDWRSAFLLEHRYIYRPPDTKA